MSQRASRFYWVAGIVFTISIAILGFSAWFIADRILVQPQRDEMDIPVLIFRIFQSLAFSGIVFVSIKGLIALGRSFLHEATRLLERRHALRFGRLYMYLKKGEFDLTELQDAFQWNKEATTSFLDMSPEIIAETVFNQLARLSPQALELWTRALSDAVKKTDARKDGRSE